MNLAPTLRRFVVVSLLATSVAFAGAGGANPSLHRTDPKCLPVGSGLLQNLKASLRAKARGKLGTPKGVKSNGQFEGLRDLREGPVYFVSARVRGYRIATWAVAGEAFKTGGGLIIGVGPIARRVSTAGDLLTDKRGYAAGWGLTAAADGYAASRACVK